MRISLENFRSFDATGILDFNDLNILIGKNSSGKSSLLRFFPLMKQTFSHDTSEPILWYSPEYVDFGEFHDVVGSNKDKPITFNYNFMVSPKLLVPTFVNSIRFTSSEEIDSLLSTKDFYNTQSKELSLKIDILKDYIPKIVLSFLGVEIEIISNKRNEVLSFSVNGKIVYKKDEENKTLRVLGRKRKLLPQFRVIDMSSSLNNEKTIQAYTNGISGDFNANFIYPLLESLMWKDSKEEILINESRINSMLLPTFFEMDRKKYLIK